jgi:peptide subunit release factor 1 (eRF1)
MITCDFAILPVGTETTECKDYVTAAVQSIKDSGLSYQLTGMGTQIEADNLEERCPNCNELLKEEESADLADYFVEKAEEMSTNVEFISTETDEGMQLYRAFGGIAAILRYHVEY